MTPGKITAIILTGGKSSRMGADKGLLHLEGMTLVEHAIATMSRLTNDIILSANSPEYRRFGYPVVNDIHSDIGPMGGIHAGLLASSSRTNMVLSCDMPVVTHEIFLYLLSLMGTAQIAVPVHREGHFEPVCAVYSKDALPWINTLIGRGIYKLPELFRRVETVEAALPVNRAFYHKDYFLNINTKDDLAKAREILSGLS